MFFPTNTCNLATGNCVQMDTVRMVKTIRNQIRGTAMRGNQEAYILVKVKDGRKFVCAINRLKNAKKNTQVEQSNLKLNLEKDVLWQ